MELIFFHFGRYILLLKGAFSKPENWSVYRKELVREMVNQGWGSMGIVVFISIFLGMGAAVQTAYQLVSSIVPIEVIGQITRDSTIMILTPTITMLVLAGRVGSNIASQIGTMRVTEQIDALEIMGVNSAAFLIMPKIIAGEIMLPVISMIGMFLSIVGGYIAAVVGSLTTSTQFINGLLREFDPHTLVVGIVKLYIFAFILTSISAYQGFYASGGTVEVGKTSTRAVVFSCIVILFFDYIIAQVLL